MDKPQYQLIKTPKHWATCLKMLQDEPRLAVDLEANSMYAYRESVCLIQVSIPQQDFIIDPLAPLNLDGFGQILKDPSIEKIFHAAEYDLILMKRQYDWELNNLFDTMWAARILGYHRYGLASLLEQFFDVHLNKRYQKSNWCKRPLSSAQLSYACFDTHFLFRLRDKLAAEIIERGRLAEATETFADHTKVTVSDNGFDPDSFWSINGAHDLTRQQQAILKALNIYRDQEAKKRDQPLFKIFSDRTLLEIAQRSPVNLAELADIHGMSKGQIRRYGRQLLDVIRIAMYQKPPVLPQRTKRASDSVIARYEKLHTWRKNRARARGVESDVIISRNALWELAHNNPKNDQELNQIESIGARRCETYGMEILQVLQDSANG